MATQGSDSDGRRWGARPVHPCTDEAAAPEEQVRELLGHRTLELETLNAIAAAVASSLRIDEVLQRALESVLRIEGLRPQGGIFLMDDDERGLRLAVHRGLAPEFVAREQRIRVGECLCGGAAASREIIVSTNSQDDARHCRASAEARPHAHIVVPLTTYDRVQGVLFLYPEYGRELSADDRRFFTTVGSQIGMAIENARVYGHTDAELRTKVAELRTSVEELMRERARTDVAQHAKDDLVAMMSHDLATPLSAIVVQAELLVRRARAEHREADEKSSIAVQRNARRMAAMIADLVESVHLESGKIALRPLPVSLADVAADVLETLPAAERERVAVVAPTDLPPALADRARIVRALMNLVTNALKYSPPGGVVSIGFEASDCEVLGTVRDRGIGIDAESLPHVFDRFYRIGAPRGPAGLGLGLYITRLLVEAHGGRIWAESAPGEGSTFRFTLPVAAVAAPR